MITKINVDSFWDIMPIISTLTNVINLFIKFGMMFLKQETINKHEHLRFLQQKTVCKCILYAVSLIGNIFASHPKVIQEKADDWSHLECPTLSSLEIFFQKFGLSLSPILNI